ncbi:MAG: hypothetical protein ABFR89_00250 [Actinomycetota bacterium]
MTKTFSGDVLLPGDDGGGLAATLALDPMTVTLTAGDNQLGTWDRSDYLIAPEQNGTYSLTLGGESLLFRPDSPAEFASTSAIPLAASGSRSKQSTSSIVEDDDAFVAAAVAGVRPMKSLNDNGGMSKTFVALMVLATIVLSVGVVLAASMA